MHFAFYQRNFIIAQSGPRKVGRFMHTSQGGLSVAELSSPFHVFVQKMKEIFCPLSPAWLSRFPDWTDSWKMQFNENHWAQNSKKPRKPLLFGYIPDKH